MVDDESDEPDAGRSDPDGVIRPDSVSSSGSDAVSGAHDLAERAVDVLLDFLRRARALVRGVLIFAVVACVGGYVLGLAALDGGLRTLWMVVGGFAGLWAIGSVAAALFRLGAIRRGGAAMVDEVRSLIDGDHSSTRTVVETVEATEGARNTGIVVMSRGFFSLRDVVEDRRSDFVQLSAALASITTVPGAVALATVIGFGFAGLSVIFALVLLF